MPIVADADRDPTGRIKITPMRLDAETLARLDFLVADMAAGSRATAVRQLIREESQRRGFGPKTGAKKTSRKNAK